MLVGIRQISFLTETMTELLDQSFDLTSVFCSSVSADVWHARTEEKAYDTWYFDALSDDGREALAITFTDNYVFSPRYAEPVSFENPVADGDEATSPRRFPAVTFVYSVDGKTIFRTVSEFSYRHFHAVPGELGCSIGGSSFKVETAEYGKGYWVQIDVPIGPNNRLRAAIEWLTVEADFIPDTSTDLTKSSWNMVAARSDVTGRIDVVDRKGKSKQVIHVRGTGYHDQISSSEALQDMVSCRQWGRAHFTDCTAVFCVQNRPDKGEIDAKLVVTRDGSIKVRPGRVEQLQTRRDRFGIKYPTRINLFADENVRLRIKPVSTLESSFYNVRFLSEMTLMLRDGKPRKAIGISEIVSPGNGKNRLFRWFSDLRIGKNGKRPMF